MADIAKTRKLLEAVKKMAVHLNDDEINNIFVILLMAIERLEMEGVG